MCLEIEKVDNSIIDDLELKSVLGNSHSYVIL